MSKLSHRLRRIPVNANKRILEALRSPEADGVLDLPVESGDFSRLRGQRHCLLVSYRRDGQPIAQPVWPGYDGDRIYIWTEAEAFKAKRLRRNPAALIGPCSFRGKPLGPPIAATARILVDDAERAHAEGIIRSQWGWKRRTFERISRPMTPVIYIELTPQQSGAATDSAKDKADGRTQT